MKLTKHATIVMMVVAMACTFLTGCRVEDSGVKIIRVALNQATNHPEYIALDDFGKKFEEATGGAYKVEVYPNAVLGDQGEVTEMVRTGAI